MCAYYDNIASILGIPEWLLIIIVVWTLVWKLLATWKAARKNQLIWFVVLFLVNTVGILEILYLYVFSELKPKPKKRTQAKPIKKSESAKKKK